MLFAQESQNSLSLVIGHLLLHAFFQYKHIYWTNADVSLRVQFSGLRKDTFLSSLMSSLLSSNKERLDLPSTCRLFEGLPGVLPSTTMGRLAAILDKPEKVHHFQLHKNILWNGERLGAIKFCITLMYEEQIKKIYNVHLFTKW